MPPRNVSNHVHFLRRLTLIIILSISLQFSFSSLNIVFRSFCRSIYLKHKILLRQHVSKLSKIFYSTLLISMFHIRKALHFKHILWRDVYTIITHYWVIYSNLLLFVNTRKVCFCNPRFNFHDISLFVLVLGIWCFLHIKIICYFGYCNVFEHFINDIMSTIQTVIINKHYYYIILHLYKFV